MKMSRTPLLAAGLTLLACVPATAQAQGLTRPERPYRGIFAGGVDLSGQSLTAKRVVERRLRRQRPGGGHEPGLGPQPGGQGGRFGQASGSLNYALNAERANFNAAAGTSQRYYPTLQDNVLRLLPRQHLRLAAGDRQAGNQPASGAFVPAIHVPLGVSRRAGPAIAADDVADPGRGADRPTICRLQRRPRSSHQQIARRASFDTFWNYHTTNRDTNALWRQTAGASFSFGMTRDLSLRLGYNYTRAQTTTASPRVHRPGYRARFRPRAVAHAPHEPELRRGN